MSREKEKRGPALVIRGHLYPSWGRHPPFFEVLGIEPWALHVLGTNATTDAIPSLAVLHASLSYIVPDN